MLVLQVSSNGLSSATGPGPGLLLKIDTATGDRTTIASEGLVFPGAVAVGPDGTLFVSNHSNASSGGQVLSIRQVPEPSSWLLAAFGVVLAALNRYRSTASANRRLAL
ncbi:MAG: PEP-CTERM sorting domain-containing protein [Pirellulales bacterium]